MRITMVIPSISAGGAERVMATMANYWAERGRAISLITFDDGSTADSYRLAPQIDRVRLNIAGTSGSVAIALKNNLGRVRRLRRAIRETEPDCVISFLDSVNVLTLIATRKLGIPVIVSERVYSSLNNIGPVWSSLRNRTYPWADAVVGATARVITDLPSGIVPLGKVIANPVTLDPDRGKLKPEWPEGPVMISAGRLDPQKGLDTLLGAFATVAESLPGWNLVILGDGPQRSALESLARDLKICGRVRFLGRVNNPHDYMRRARIFVLSSRFEGFPNALCEAMACGLPVIATDCPSGPRELISDGIDGLLVPVDDIDALARAIKKLASDESLRRGLGESAKNVSERFSVDRIMKEWDELLREVIERKARFSG
jgi:glycosyltransferase involved in cell wall biosynthesis